MTLAQILNVAVGISLLVNPIVVIITIINFILLILLFKKIKKLNEKQTVIQ